jgi:peptide deformylase
MTYPIYLYGEKILRDKAVDVDPTDPTLMQLISDMFETMHNANGAGLSAPQIGISKKIIVIEEELSDGELFKGVFINPKIIAYSGRNVYSAEGCLSFPGIPENIIRPLTIEVEWLDEKLELQHDFFHDIPSRILQHEIDHLNGILFIDKMNYVDRLGIFMKLEAIKEKKVKTSYPTV